MSYQPYKTIRRPRNVKFLAVNGVSIYPLSLLELNQMSVIAPCFGSFSSTTTQSIATAPAVTSLTYNTTDITRGGVALSGATPTASIRVPAAGVYRILYSAQLNKQPSGGSTGDVYVWCALNGTAIPNTATKSAVSNAIEEVMTVEVLVSAVAGDLISIQANATNGGEEVLAEVASGSRPAIPSIITIVQRIT